VTVDPGVSSPEGGVEGVDPRKYLKNPEDTPMSRRSRWMGRTLAVAAAGMAIGLLGPPASAQEIRRDVRELRHDRREIRPDSREIRGDRRELRQDVADRRGR
jgi:hypothetical protein